MPMKMIVEINRLTSGTTDAGVPWVRLGGRDHHGRSMVATAYRGKAQSLLGDLDSLVPSGEDIASRRLIVELIGEFKDGKQVLKDGKPKFKEDGITPVRYRNFEIESHVFLTGPILELARIRRDAEAVLARVKTLMEAGNISAATEALALFAAKAANRPLDIVFNDQVDEADEAFGIVTPPEAEPVAPIETPDVVTEVAAVVAPERVEEPVKEVASAVVDVPAFNEDPEAAAAAAFAIEDRMSSPVRDRSPAASDSAPVVDRDVLDDELPAASASPAPPRRGLMRPGAVNPAAARPATVTASRPEPSPTRTERPAPVEPTVREESEDTEVVDTPAPRRRIGLQMRR